MKSITLPVILLFTTGCAPLSQAPLVYNSKVIFGGRISATNPQTPGVDINVGLTTEDSAFIPVAVAKLPEKLGGDSGNADIVPIKGTYAGSMNPASVEAAADALRIAQATLLQKSKAIIDIQKQIDANKANNATYTNLNEQKVMLATEQNNLDSASPEFATKNNELNIKLQSIANQLGQLPNPVFLSNQAVQLSADLTQTQIEKDSAETNVKKATAELEKVEGKTDAYSVFGSFDSGTNLTGSTSAGVTLGKMFSTGVAAQNISQGIQQSHNYLAIKACLDSLKTVVSGTVSADNAEKICGK